VSAGADAPSSRRARPTCMPRARVPRARPGLASHVHAPGTRPTYIAPRRTGVLPDAASARLHASAPAGAPPPRASCVRPPERPGYSACAMSRHFNTAGPCDPVDHYMLPPEQRLPRGASARRAEGVLRPPRPAAGRQDDGPPRARQDALGRRTLRGAARLDGDRSSLPRGRRRGRAGHPGWVAHGREAPAPHRAPAPRVARRGAGRADPVPRWRRGRAPVRDPWCSSSTRSTPCADHVLRLRAPPAPRRATAAPEGDSPGRLRSWACATSATTSSRTAPQRGDRDGDLVLRHQRRARFTLRATSRTRRSPSSCTGSARPRPGSASSPTRCDRGRSCRAAGSRGSSMRLPISRRWSSSPTPPRPSPSTTSNAREACSSSAKGCCGRPGIPHRPPGAATPARRGRSSPSRDKSSPSRGAARVKRLEVRCRPRQPSPGLDGDYHHHWLTLSGDRLRPQM
jgi:hypothetical protein